MPELFQLVYFAIICKFHRFWSDDWLRMLGWWWIFNRRIIGFINFLLQTPYRHHVLQIDPTRWIYCGLSSSPGKLYLFSLFYYRAAADHKSIFQLTLEQFTEKRSRSLAEVPTVRVSKSYSSVRRQGEPRTEDNISFPTLTVRDPNELFTGNKVRASQLTATYS